MHYGLIFGFIWCISFVLLVSKDPAMKSFFSILFLSLPFIGFYLAHRFKTSVQYDGDVTYLRGLSFSILFYLYATAILAITVYLYFQFLDKGDFIRQNLALLPQPEVKAILEGPEMKNSGITITDLEAAIKSINPMTATAAIININVLLSLPLALITAFFTVTKQKTN